MNKQQKAHRFYFDEINAEPVVFHWTWHLDDIDPYEAVKSETLSDFIVKHPLQSKPHGFGQQRMVSFFH